MLSDRQYCTFLLNGHGFGIDVMEVQEVIRHLVVTRVPLAPPFVRGLINLRGQIVTAVDLRRRLEMPDRPADMLPVNVVVSTDDGPVSLLGGRNRGRPQRAGDGIRTAAGDAPWASPIPDPRCVQVGRPAPVDPEHESGRDPGERAGFGAPAGKLRSERTTSTDTTKRLSRTQNLTETNQ